MGGLVLGVVETLQALGRVVPSAGLPRPGPWSLKPGAWSLEAV